MKLFITRFAIASVCLVVTSMSVNADVAQCTAIESSLDRLACYDKEAGFEPEVKVFTGNGDWQVRLETSKIDDSKEVFLTLYSTEQTNCPYKEGRHSIHLACRENKTNIWVQFGECFMTSIQGNGRVTYRLDSEDAATKSFRESNNNMALGLWDGGSAIPFINGMIGHDKMVIRATPFSSSTVTGEYNIAGLDQAVRPLREACGW